MNRSTVTRLDLLIRSLGKTGLWVNVALGFAFLYLPIAILVVYSFNASRFNAVWSGFTLDWYRSLLGSIPAQTADLSTTGVWSALYNSLIVATISSAIATILGTAIALGLERYKFPGYQLLESLLFLPMVIPEITLGISLLVFMTLIFRLVENLTGMRISLGLPTVIIGHITFSISFVTIVVRARVADLDPRLEEAALDLGANEWRVFQRVTFPLIWPGIFSAGLLAFTLSLDDFVVSFFTSGVGATTLPLFVYGMIKLSVTPAINAISTLMLLISLILLLSSLKLGGTAGLE
ncbi:MULTISPECIES: ABC transporter permease [Oscillatoriales]|uniref:ABC transporter permease n=1 Tax=Limnospira fusiformis PMC 851.14 TaxID=2219512 RepID=A0ABU9EJL1_LIMFS|nr:MULTISPECIES: ABC transporter permease [Oscillatoriales]AMW30392.1 ABC transporter permease [Arthrospira platensis YZ]EKD06151.1 putative binding-protein-dependent transport systems inner membrane component [Arthrospira platensis C1]KDR59187.1 ABC transporter permease [Arthrospira platensis str. Paraca]MBD2668120.1 ABC transporter permease [Arthrospira platensis FACHB-439]MDT9309193.1 ABC transporter permease [Limnospira sp. Paracas R14]MDY7055035.1 ABC transporter permease [Limnospira fus